jgi:hypothetical protein
VHFFYHRLHRSPVIVPNDIFALFTRLHDVAAQAAALRFIFLTSFGMLSIFVDLLAPRNYLLSLYQTPSRTFFHPCGGQTTLYGVSQGQPQPCPLPITMQLRDTFSSMCLWQVRLMGTLFRTTTWALSYFA